MSEDTTTIRLDDLVDQMSDVMANANVKITKGDLAIIIANTFGTIVKNMNDGNKVVIHKFGTFATRERGARKGRNPATGKEIQIASSTVPFFKSSTTLKNVVNGKADEPETKVKTVKAPVTKAPKAKAKSDTTKVSAKPAKKAAKK